MLQRKESGLGKAFAFDLFASGSNAKWATLPLSLRGTRLTRQGNLFYTRLVQIGSLLKRFQRRRPFLTAGDEVESETFRG